MKLKIPNWLETTIAVFLLFVVATILAPYLMTMSLWDKVRGRE